MYHRYRAALKLPANQNDKEYAAVVNEELNVPFGAVTGMPLGLNEEAPEEEEADRKDDQDVPQRAPGSSRSPSPRSSSPISPKTPTKDDESVLDPTANWMHEKGPPSSRIGSMYYQLDDGMDDEDVLQCGGR